MQLNCDIKNLSRLDQCVKRSIENGDDILDTRGLLLALTSRSRAKVAVDSTACLALALQDDRSRLCNDLMMSNAIVSLGN